MSCWPPAAMLTRSTAWEGEWRGAVVGARREKRLLFAFFQTPIPFPLPHRSALLEAIKHAKDAVVQRLLEAGAAWHLSTVETAAELCGAVFSMNLPFLKRALVAARPDAGDYDQRTPVSGNGFLGGRKDWERDSLTLTSPHLRRTLPPAKAVCPPSKNLSPRARTSTCAIAGNQPRSTRRLELVRKIALITS